MKGVEKMVITVHKIMLRDLFWYAEEIGEV